MNAHTPMDDATRRRFAKADWLRALHCAAGVEKDHGRTLADAFDEIAQRRGAALALISRRETYSFAELRERSNRCARWALAQGLHKGETVGLYMENRADYLAIWLGLTRVGVVVALLNVNLTGAALAHCLDAAAATCVIASQETQTRCRAALAFAKTAAKAEIFGAEDAFANFSGAPLEAEERRDVALSDRALYIYTSGTTGLPKAAVVTHRRVMHWSYWFMGLADIGAEDRMYNCLPLYHSVGGVVAVWPTLLAGGSVVVRERFSASAFWEDVAAQRCTLFQYIGELCRYLVNAPPHPLERSHTLRMAVGNGLRKEVWTQFQTRFSIPRILEFYAATESNFSLYNVEGEPGAVGRIPSFVALGARLNILRRHAETGELLRDAAGHFVACGVNEAGEAVARIDNDFEGYLDAEATRRKILRNVFEDGDAFMRSGDLMRKDARGFYYFVDRVGDTFRWKGENVATTEVAQALASCPGVLDADVYGVEIPGHDGRAGMAALCVSDDFDLKALRAHVDARLPAYARPLFLRIGGALAMTETFKHKSRELALQGFDPDRVADALYFAAPGDAAYARLDAALYKSILAGERRL